MIRSIVVVFIGTATLFVLQLLAESNAAAFTSVPWVASLAVLGSMLAIFGGVAYRFLHGSIVIRFVLIALMVAIANFIAEFVIGSDQAYPALGLWLIIPFVVVCWIGAAIAFRLAKRDGASAKSKGR